MKYSNLLILGGVGVVIYLILKNKKKEIKTIDSFIKKEDTPTEMNPYLVEKQTMRPPLFSGDYVADFNTSQYATIAPSTLRIYKFK